MSASKVEILKRYFGHDGFRPGQEELVDALSRGQDALGVMPTGAGKSMCYQVPALMTEGVTLVVSPLISLMKDQVAALRSAGVPAAYLNSSLTPAQLDLATERAREGQYRIIYVAPERLETYGFRQFAQNSPIRLVAVDEAHCVSQWGQDFRPDYLRIADFVDSLPQRPPVGAFTATATAEVRRDILRLLRLRDPVTVCTGFDRPNLFFEVDRPKQRKQALLRILRERGEDSAIVYCATRKAVEEVTESLQDAGISAVRYHAGLTEEERMQNQEDFQYDRVRVMVATNAFGMGIDKSNVRLVIHYNMPKSIEAYYQEAGRAGRDGEPAGCVLLYSGQDIFTARYLIQHGEPNERLTAEEQALVRRRDLQRLQRMIGYATEEGCLRGKLLRYFGQAHGSDCGGCSACAGPRYLSPEVRPARPARAEEPVPGYAGKVAMATAVKPAAKRLQTTEDALFERLRACRLALSKRYRVAPYIICDDKTLRDMARRRPQTRAGLLTVHGIGELKAERYGDEFLQALRDWEDEQRKLTVKRKTAKRQ